MSRGGWIMIIGGVILLVGIGLFAFGFASFFADFNPASTNLAPGDHLNRTFEALALGSSLTYLVEIQDFAAGDEVTVFVQLPSGGEAQRTTVNTSSTLTQLYSVTESGTHTLVIQNTASQSVDILSAVNKFELGSATLLTIGFFLGIAGFIVLIVGLILWAIDRGRRRRQPVGMPPPPT
ncbi:MAG: hypothetical protein ACE5LS_08705 [Thermoplasmata archaeon]